MQNILHKSYSRGHADHGWLNSHHTFSFASYYHPERMHFGAIRVLNDDIVQGDTGFGTHPHANMEIVSIPLSGALEHKDSTGRHKIIKTGEVQIMSAGTGIEHSEYNASPTAPVNFLQIWVLPAEQNISPRYEQKEFPWKVNQNQWVNVVAPDNTNAIWINQQAWFYLGSLEKDRSLAYKLKEPENGVYLFVIEGEVSLGDQILQKRDGIGLVGWETIDLSASANSRLLLIETTMMV